MPLTSPPRRTWPEIAQYDCGSIFWLLRSAKIFAALRQNYRLTANDITSHMTDKVQRNGRSNRNSNKGRRNHQSNAPPNASSCTFYTIKSTAGNMETRKILNSREYFSVVRKDAIVSAMRSLRLRSLWMYKHPSFTIYSEITTRNQNNVRS